MAANPVVPKPQLELHLVRSADEIAVICSGRINADTRDLLAEEVRALIPETKQIVLDLSRVSYLDSSGLGTLVGLYISARKSGRILKLINLTDRVADLLRITKIASIFDEYGQYL